MTNTNGGFLEWRRMGLLLVLLLVLVGDSVADS